MQFNFYILSQWINWSYPLLNWIWDKVWLYILLQWTVNVCADDEVNESRVVYFCCCFGIHLLFDIHVWLVFSTSKPCTLSFKIYCNPVTERNVWLNSIGCSDIQNIKDNLKTFFMYSKHCYVILCVVDKLLMVCPIWNWHCQFQAFDFSLNYKCYSFFSFLTDNILS